MKTLTLYLKERRRSLYTAALALAVFGAVGALYGVGAEVFAYGALLFGTLLLISLGIGFFGWKREKSQREYALSSAEWAEEALPPCDSLAELQYREAAERLFRDCRETETAFAAERQESLDYVTAWAHQIKTPIAVMEMMLRDGDTQEHRALSAELFRISRYVETMLGYIRLGSEAGDFVFREVRLDDVIRAAVRKYAPQFIHKRLSLKYDPVDVVALTDEKWLGLMMEQLLSNAVKYTASGRVTITVTPERVITVSDTGIGIAEEDLPRVFEKGFTGYNGRMDRKSTGLGLYLCKQIAGKLGITLSVESGPGKGTSVSMALPARTEFPPEQEI